MHIVWSPSPASSRSDKCRGLLRKSSMVVYETLANAKGPRAMVVYHSSPSFAILIRHHPLPSTTTTTILVQAMFAHCWTLCWMSSAVWSAGWWSALIMKYEDQIVRPIVGETRHCAAVYAALELNWVWEEFLHYKKWLDCASQTLVELSLGYLYHTMGSSADWLICTFADHAPRVGANLKGLNRFIVATAV